MFTTQSVNQDLFRPLQLYFEALKNSHPITWVDENELYVSRGREVYFRVKLTHIEAGNHCQKAIIHMSANRSTPLIVTTEVCGNDQELNLNSFFTGEFIYPFDSYYLDFGRWPLNIWGENQNGNLQTVYNSGSSGTKIIHNQMSSTTELFAELYYICDTCHGDPVALKVSKSGDLILNRFYLEHVGKPVTAKAFFERASGYLGYPRSLWVNIINSFTSNGGWPKVN